MSIKAMTSSKSKQKQKRLYLPMHRSYDCKSNLWLPIYLWLPIHFFTFKKSLLKLQRFHNFDTPLHNLGIYFDLVHLLKTALILHKMHYTIKFQIVSFHYENYQ